MKNGQKNCIPTEHILVRTIKKYYAYIIAYSTNAKLIFLGERDRGMERRDGI